MTRIIPLGLLILGIAGFGYIAWNTAQREQRLYPAKITIEARPGAAVLVPFKRRLERAQKNILSVIYGSAFTDPNPLPDGLEVLRSDVLFMTSGASGEVVVWLPPEALGEYEFSITAWAEASIVGAGGTRLNSDSAVVTLKVAGNPIVAPEPDFAGEWSDQVRQWKFAADGGRNLTIADADGAATIAYDLYPDQNGRWILVETTKINPRAYWIEADGEFLKVSWLGKEFKPFSELQRRRSG